MEGRLKVNVSITLYSETDGDKLIQEIENVFKDLEPEINTDKNYIFVSWTENTTYYYSPAVYYLSNGDPGYPEEYEEYTEWDEDDIRDEIESWYERFNFDIEEINVSKESDDGERW